MSKSPNLTRETSLPSITRASSVKDPAVARILAQLKEILDVRMGGGDPLDAWPTIRSLYKDGAIDVKIGSKLYQSQSSSSGLISAPSSYVDTTVPPTPTGFSTSSAFTVIFLQWDAPNYGNHAYTEILRATVNDLGQAVVVGREDNPSTKSTDPVGLTGTGYYYWIRFVSTGNKAGAVSAVQFGSTGYIGNNDLTDLIITAEKISDGSINLGSSKVSGLLSQINLGQISDPSRLASAIIASSHIAPLAVDYSTHVNGTPLSLADINPGEGWHLGSIEMGADVSPAAGNLIKNSDFLNDLSFWEMQGTTPNSALVFGRNYSPDWTLENGSTAYIMQTDGNEYAGTYKDVLAQDSPVERTAEVLPGQWYQASAYVGSHRCDVRLHIGWYRADGTVISFSTCGESLNESGGGRYLAGYNRIWGVAQAPAGSVRALVFVKKYPTLQGIGATNSFAFVTRVMFGEGAEHITSPSPWSPADTRDARLINYADETRLEDLKPAEAGATLGANFLTNLINSPTAISDININESRALHAAVQSVFTESFESAIEWNERSGNGVMSYPLTGSVGGKSLRVSDGRRWLAFPENTPFNPSILYRLRCRVRMTVAPTDPALARFYCGLEGVGADGSTLVNAVGDNSYGGQHYLAAVFVDMGSYTLGDWVEFIGYFQGHGTPISNTGDPMSPSPLHADVRYFRPMVIVNYGPELVTDGEMELDYIEIDIVSENGVYSDGVFLEALKPASAGADPTALNTSLNTQYVGSSAAAIVESNAANGNTFTSTDAGSVAYGDTVDYATQVAGAQRPANNATVGATIGIDLGGLMSSSNIMTYIEAGAIGSALIGSAAIGTLAVQDGAITNAKIFELSADKITAGTITAAVSIVAPTIVGGTVSGTTINGTTIVGGSVSGTTINGGSINGAELDVGDGQFNYFRFTLAGGVELGFDTKIKGSNAWGNDGIWLESSFDEDIGVYIVQTSGLTSYASTATGKLTMEADNTPTSYVEVKRTWQGKFNRFDFAYDFRAKVAIAIDRSVDALSYDFLIAFGDANAGVDGGGSVMFVKRDSDTSLYLRVQTFQGWGSIPYFFEIAIPDTLNSRWLTPEFKVHFFAGSRVDFFLDGALIGSISAIDAGSGFPVSLASYIFGARCNGDNYGSSQYRDLSLGQLLISQPR